MSGQGWLQIVLFLGVVLVLVRPLGAYMARVFERVPIFGMDRALRPVETVHLQAGRHRPRERDDLEEVRRQRPRLQRWWAFLLLYLLQRVQGWLPGGPEGMGNVRPDLAFNTAVSFVTNTNWQAYGGETTMKYVTQMLGMTVQNFVSAGTGIAVVIALIRGFSRRSTDRLGNFWVDLTRSVLYVLLPSFLRLRHRAGLTGSRADVGTCAGGATGAVVRGRGRRDGHVADDRGRSGGLAARHQAAGHQRRRLLQRELVASVREPHAPHQLPGAGGDTPHPSLSLLHLRTHGGQHQSRVGWSWPS